MSSKKYTYQKNDRKSGEKLPKIEDSIDKQGR